MTWPEDELRRLRDEKIVGQQRLAQETVERERQARQARQQAKQAELDLEARIAHAPQENAKDVIRFKQMLDARGVPGLLGDIKRYFGGVVIFKERKFSEFYDSRVATAAYGLVRITTGQTTHYKGGGESHTERTFSADAGGSTGPSYSVQTERYNLDETPFDIAVIAIGIKHEVRQGGPGWDDTPMLYSLANAGSLTRRVDYPAGLLSSLIRVPLSTSFKYSEGSDYLDSSHDIGGPFGVGSTRNPRFAISNSIDPYIFSLDARGENRFSPTQDPAADKEVIRGILVGELGKIAT